MRGRQKFLDLVMRLWFYATRHRRLSVDKVVIEVLATNLRNELLNNTRNCLSEWRFYRRTVI